VSRQRTLVKASRLLRARRFSEVISLLEPQVFLYRENFGFYYLLGVACLYVGDYGGAHSYLQRAEQIRPGRVGVLLGLAAVNLRRREVPQALQHWLRVLDEEPGNRAARRGLELVRRTEDPGDFVAMAESGRLRRFYPPLGFRLPRWIIVVVAVAVVAVGLGLTLPDLIERRSQVSLPTREGSEFTALPDDEDLTNFEGSYRYVLTPEQVEETFSRAGAYFNDFRDNLAQREVNRLRLSNAGNLVKERARLLESYFRAPTFVTFEDNLSYAEVAAEPWLYDKCYVRWSGQTSNVVITDEAITFTLLVGYEDERVLEGTVPVTVPFAAEVEAGPVELIGRISWEDEQLALEATSIRRIVPGPAR
jgi:tetratricopeptide (TPR) repeat protein